MRSISLLAGLSDRLRFLLMLTTCVLAMSASMLSITLPVFANDSSAASREHPATEQMLEMGSWLIFY